MTALTRENLQARTRRVGVSSTAGRARPIRIVHLGASAFFRAHVAWATDHADPEGEWGIAAFTGRSPKQANILTDQDGLFTLLIRGDQGDDAEIISSVSAAHDGADIDALTRLLADPEVAVVTVTITRDGYPLTADDALDTEDDRVVADLTALADGSAAPAGPLARLVLGLQARMDAGAGPIAVVPCDSITNSGPVTREAVLTLARARSGDLADWVSRNVSFCSTSVDRTTPLATDEDVQEVQAVTGLRDAAPAVCEPFFSWIIEGDFPAGRPAWEKAGAVFTDDLGPFERRREWLHDGAGILMANLGQQLGCESPADAMADDFVHRAIKQWWNEAERHLPASVDAQAYRHALADRFENSRIDPALADMAVDSLQKLKDRIVPVALLELRAGRLPEGALTAIAAWVERWLTGSADPDAQSDRIERALAGVDGQFTSDVDWETDAESAAEKVRVLLQLLSPELAANRRVVDHVRAEVASELNG
ncbi:mannitol dehydrogenase family protein [Helcobacillus massiliensis]|uniref:mannitol dehydrogenase family protein n=1 Tax=Helcobacillus massiliensis TaxID=521392 RepID=UPI0021A27503|nr:mannitol dehydrogenase family protein [Helcobacillus massiliensis]MCT1557791.1 mannitol dehydrogenase family protein [Helcobacillus massiliensis]MCT2036971.1 mannitol dehydrogenase family protein [Helcobacillus massiliensis]MCT2332184.1 mannitol dehydrogenase family protein [Helcobacillus massiliensis]